MNTPEAILKDLQRECIVLERKATKARNAYEHALMMLIAAEREQATACARRNIYEAQHHHELSVSPERLNELHSI